MNNTSIECTALQPRASTKGLNQGPQPRASTKGLNHRHSLKLNLSQISHYPVRQKETFYGR